MEIQGLINTLMDKGLRTDVRIDAATKLGQDKIQQAIPYLLQCLAEENAYLRANVISALGDIGAKKAVKPLIAILQNDGNYHVRRATAYALGEIKGPQALTALNTSLTTENAVITRLALINAIKNIGGARALTALKIAAKDKNRDVSKAAKQAIVELQGEKQ